MTNAGLLDCKIAIEEAGWELDSAVKILISKGFSYYPIDRLGRIDKPCRKKGSSMFDKIEEWTTRSKIHDYLAENVDANSKYFLDLYEGKVFEHKKYKFRRIGAVFVADSPLNCKLDIFYDILEEELNRRQLWYGIGKVKGKDYTLILNPQCKASTSKPWIIDGFLTVEDIPDPIFIRFQRWLYEKYFL